MRPYLAQDVIAAAQRPPNEASRATTSKDAGARKVSGFVSVIGLLAALASVLTGLSSKLNSGWESEHQAALSLSQTLSTARRDWYNGKSKDDALRVIERLDAELIKYR